MTTRDQYVESMKSAFVSLATQASLAWFAVLSKGATNNWFAKKFLTIILENLFKFIATQSELSVFFFYIDTRVGAQSAAFEAAALANWKVQQHGTKEEKQVAEEILWNRFREFAVLSY